MVSDRRYYARFFNPSPSRLPGRREPKPTAFSSTKKSKRSINYKENFKEFGRQSALTEEDYSVFEDIPPTGGTGGLPIVWYRAAYGGLQVTPYACNNQADSQYYSPRTLTTGFQTLDRSNIVYGSKYSEFSGDWPLPEIKEENEQDSLQIDYPENADGTTGWYPADYDYKYIGGDTGSLSMEGYMNDNQVPSNSANGGFDVYPPTLKWRGWLNQIDVAPSEGRVDWYYEEFRRRALARHLDENTYYTLYAEGEWNQYQSTGIERVSVSYNSETRQYFVFSTWGIRLHDGSEWFYDIFTDEYTYGDGYNTFFYVYDVIDEETGSLVTSVSIKLATGTTRCISFYPMDGYGGDANFNDYVPGAPGWAGVYQSLAHENDESIFARVAGYTGAYYKKIVTPVDWVATEEGEEPPQHAVMVVPLTQHIWSGYNGWKTATAKLNIIDSVSETYLTEGGTGGLYDLGTNCSEFAVPWQHLDMTAIQVPGSGGSFPPDQHFLEYTKWSYPVGIYYPTMAQGIPANDDYSIGQFLLKRVLDIKEGDILGNGYDEEERTRNGGISRYESFTTDNHGYTYDQTRVDLDSWDAPQELARFTSEMVYNIYNQYLAKPIGPSGGGSGWVGKCDGEEQIPDYMLLFTDSEEHYEETQIDYPQRFLAYTAIAENVPDILVLWPYTNGTIELTSYTTISAKLEAQRG